MKPCFIFAEGRQKERSLQQICVDYYKRCSRWLKIQEREFKNLSALGKAIPDRAVLVALDERGQQFTSVQFAQTLRSWIEGPMSQIIFVIGGADGLDASIRDRATLLLSLGQMTFAHRLVRPILAEQLYRAISIIEGSPYHRD